MAEVVVGSGVVMMFCMMWFSGDLSAPATCSTDCAAGEKGLCTTEGRVGVDALVPPEVFQQWQLVCCPADVEELGPARNSHQGQ